MQDAVDGVDADAFNFLHLNGFPLEGFEKPIRRR